MRTIEEIMGLVSKQVDLKAALYIAGSIGAAKVISYAMKENMHEIESALRELVERKPLSDAQKQKIFIKEFKVMDGGGNIADFSDALIVATEREHKIGA